MANVHVPIFFSRHSDFGGGRGFIAGQQPGIVTVDDSPATMQVFLMQRHPLRLLGETWSRLDGTYSFEHLDSNQEFDLIARDHNRVYSDVIVPAITPWPYNAELTPELPGEFTTAGTYTFKVTGGLMPYSLNNVVSDVVSVTLVGDTLTIVVPDATNETVRFDIVDSSSKVVSFQTSVFVGEPP